MMGGDAAPFATLDKAIRLALEYVGRQELASCEKAKRELGWTMRPVRTTIIDTAQSMITHGIVRARGYAAAQSSVQTPQAT